jgi:hypothetical protein
MRRARNHLTYANVVATLSLVIALGGSAAYAANTVFSSDIVDGEVKTADIGTNQVRGPEIAANSVAGPEVVRGSLESSDITDQGLLGIDILDANITSLDLATNSVGPEEVRDESVSADEIGPAAVGSDEIATNAVGFFELASDSVFSANVINNSLRGVDVGEAQFVTFDANLPAVNAGRCNSGSVTGLPIDARDHLVLTEDGDTTRPWIINLPSYSTTAGTATIRRCNLASFNEPAGTHRFNLLVINAQ